jgi:DNA-binding NarL/FixJ family response regulator
MSTINHPIRIAIADDHELFREGLKYMLLKKATGVIDVVGEAENGKELIEVVRKTQPDVVLTDIKMPVIDGFEACKQILRYNSNMPVIAVSMLDDSTLIYDMLEAGAKGYLQKNAPREEVIEAIKTVNDGDIYYCKSTSKTLLKLIGVGKYNKFQKRNGVSFCNKEILIIKLICKELTTKEIADQLKLSAKTIEDYSHRIKEKVGAKNLVGIALYAVKNGFVRLTEI